jgi:hypothetical protein
MQTEIERIEKDELIKSFRKACIDSTGDKVYVSAELYSKLLMLRDVVYHVGGYTIFGKVIVKDRTEILFRFGGDYE